MECILVLDLLDFDDHQRLPVSGHTVERRTHRHQGLHRTRIRVEHAVGARIERGDQDGAGVREIDSLQVIQIEGRTAAQDDLARVPVRAQLKLDLLPEVRVRTFGQHDEAQALDTAAPQKTRYPPLGDENLIEDHR